MLANRRNTLISFVALFVGCITLLANGASACELLVRDAAFRTPRDVHRLCVIAAENDLAAMEIATHLSAWLDEHAADFNAEVVVVNADDSDVRWSDYGIPSAPPSLPVTVLVGTNREIGVSFVVRHWEPAPTDEQMTALVDSPLRRQLQAELGQHLAVLLYAPCENCEDDRVRSLLARTEREWSQRQEMGIRVIEIDRNDPAEQLFASFAGLRAGGQDWVAAVFGRGKLMNPPLIGDEINDAEVNHLIEQVLADCSCSKPLPSMGVDLPMVWTAADDETVVAMREPEATDESESIYFTSLAPAESATSPASAVAAVPAPSRLVTVESHGTFRTLAVLLGLGSLVAAASWFLVRRQT